PWCRVPGEVVSRRDFAEDDPGRRPPVRKLPAACFLGPFDLDIPEMRLAARIGVEVVYPHWRISRGVGFEAAYWRGSGAPRQPLDYAPPTMLVAAPARNQPP